MMDAQTRQLLEIAWGECAGRRYVPTVPDLDRRLNIAWVTWRDGVIDGWTDGIAARLSAERPPQDRLLEREERLLASLQRLGQSWEGCDLDAYAPFEPEEAYQALLRWVAYAAACVRWLQRGHCLEYTLGEIEAWISEHQVVQLQLL